MTEYRWETVDPYALTGDPDRDDFLALLEQAENLIYRATDRRSSRHQPEVVALLDSAVEALRQAGVDSH